MCRSIEEMLAENTAEVKREFALRMISLGKNSYEDIAKCTNLDIETVRQLAAEMKK